MQRNASPLSSSTRGECGTILGKLATLKMSTLNAPTPKSADVVEIHLDSNGNVVYCRYQDGAEVWKEYNTFGEVKHFKNSFGFEYWNEYNEGGQCTHSRHSDGFECWRKFNEGGQEVLYRDTLGGESKYDYDERENCVHAWDSSGRKRWWEYDSDGNQTGFRQEVTPPALGEPSRLQDPDYAPFPWT